MRLTVDRFEGIYAVCETEAGEMVNIPRAELSGKVKEGDIILKINNQYVIDNDASNKRKSEIMGLMEDIFE